MIDEARTAARLLPWTGLEGKPCYVLGNGTGHVSRFADNMEAVQLGMAVELLDHVDDMLEDGDDHITHPQFRYVVAALAQSLRDTHRIARSRGLRLLGPVPTGPPAGGEPAAP